MKANFHVDINDPLRYHVILNTDELSCQDAAQLIAESARGAFHPGAGGRT